MISAKVTQEFFEKNSEFFNDFILLENKYEAVKGDDIDLLWVGPESRLKEFVEHNGRLGFHPLISEARGLLYSLQKPLWIETGSLYIDVQREFFLQTVDGRNLIPYDMSVKKFVQSNFAWHTLYGCKCVVIEIRILIDIVKLIIESKDSQIRRDRIQRSLNDLSMDTLSYLLRPVFFNFTSEIVNSLSRGSVNGLRMNYLRSNNY